MVESNLEDWLHFGIFGEKNNGSFFVRILVFPTKICYTNLTSTQYGQMLCLRYMPEERNPEVQLKETVYYPSLRFLHFIPIWYFSKLPYITKL